jgi:methyltransferase
VLAVYGVWRLVELRRSAAAERRLEAAGLPRRAERAFGLMLAAHLLPFTVGAVEAARREAGPPRWVRRLALAALAFAALVRFAVQRALASAWNVRVHAGEGMRVVEEGPYRWVRHPNYLAVIVELLALPAAGGAYLTALAASVANALALRERIRVEEAALSTSPKWRERMAHKPRFVPLGSRHVAA